MIKSKLRKAKNNAMYIVNKQKKIQCNFVMSKRYLLLILYHLIYYSHNQLTFFMSQFIILKIRFEFMNSHFNGEQQEIIKQILNICFTLFSMITQALYELLGRQFHSRLGQVNLDFMLIIITGQIYRADLQSWNMYSNYLIPTSDSIMQNEGFMDYLITYSYLNIIVPSIISIFDYKYLWKKIKLLKLKIKRSNNKTQREANLLFQSREFNFYQKRIKLSKIFSATIFGFQYPPIIPLTMLSLILLYWVDKYQFINYSTPVVKDSYEKAIQSFYIAFNIYLLVYFYLVAFGFFHFWFSVITQVILLNLLFNFGCKTCCKKTFEEQTYISGMDEIIRSDLTVTDNEKHQIFLNLHKKLKNYAKKIKKSNVVDEGILLG
ncbi:unnamed protein product [Paramecium octaurelia]|uniref:Uncharacterized protein n=1 Tax=Paramecium octaurelia TaxID=43137 RepID=A0A8S1WQE5_PAROT|nr:unnamed protein product [Paramecium octaurelia]